MSSSSTATGPEPIGAERSKQPRVSASRLFLSHKARTLLLSLLLVAVVVLAYSPVARNGFINYDDDQYITDNPHVKAGLTRWTVKWAFRTFDVANYHPLTWLSHALDCQLFGVDPAAHHEVSVLLHAANAVLLFLLLQNATGFRWRSLFVAALFALHPINVESVAWISERKNVLSMLFFLCALLAYVWYARGPKLGRYALVALLFLLGLLSKPQIITLPFLLLLMDYWPLDRLVATPPDSAPTAVPTQNAPTTFPTPPRFSFGWLVLEKLPLLALSAASAIVTMMAQRVGGAVQGLSLYRPLLRVETAIISYVRYLGKAFWPTKLVVLYPHPTELYPVWQVIATALLLLLITLVVLRARDRRYLVVGWFWFLGSLVPMIGLVQVGVQSIADRYAYIPFLGLFLIVTWLVFDWVHARRISTALTAIPALALLLVLGILTYHQVGYWHDIQSFWTRTLELTENNYIAHDTLAEYLADHGQIEEATAHFRAALFINPDDLPANLGVGTYEHLHGNLQAAIERYQFVALHAGHPSVRAAAYGNLGSAYRQLGNLAQAKQCFETALAIAPNRPMALIGLGLIAQKKGDLAEAVRQYSRAMAIEPTDVAGLLLAQALEQQGHSDDARAINERVARLSPDLAAAQKQAQALLGK